jgi:hypothetical protein
MSQLCRNSVPCIDLNEWVGGEPGACIDRHRRLRPAAERARRRGRAAARSGLPVRSRVSYVAFAGWQSTRTRTHA